MERSLMRPTHFRGAKGDYLSLNIAYSRALSSDSDS